MIKKPFQINKSQINENKFYLFYGVNEGQKNDKIYELLSSIDKNNIFKYDEKEILNDERIFFDQILTKSLFNDQKIIIINRATDKIFKILNDVIDKEVNDIVIINSSALEKKSKLRNLFEKTNKFVCVAFYEDTNETLIKLASNFFKKNQILISSLDMNLIVNKCAGDRGILYNEMNKIKYYTLKNKKITSEQILKLTNLIENFSIFELVNNCLAKNKKKTLDILTENNFDNSDCIIIIRSFLLRSKKIYELRKSYEKNKDLELTIDNFKPPIFWKEKEIVKRQMTMLNYEKTKDLISKTMEIELLVKKNPQISLNITTDFVISHTK